MPIATLRIDAHIEADTPEELRQILNDLSIWNGNDLVFFDEIKIIDDSQASSEEGGSADTIRQ